jgi:hypothetical protein
VGATGVAIGLAAAVRVVGLSLVPLTIALWMGVHWARTPPDPGALSGFRRFLVPALALLAVSWTVMIAF